MSAERIASVLTALRESVPHARECNTQKHLARRRMDRWATADEALWDAACTCDYEVRVAQVQAEAVEAAIRATALTGGNPFEAGVAALEARVGAPQKEREP